MAIARRSCSGDKGFVERAVAPRRLTMREDGARAAAGVVKNAAAPRMRGGERPQLGER